MLQTTGKKYYYLTLALFGVLWLYIFLRAGFVSPLHDEVATYFHFIEPKNFWGENASLDANNHLLNSFFGWISYKLFGESFFAFRLPNVLSFALYFWGIYVLLKNLSPLYRFIVLAGIASIPYILEYFAYARGYGMSMACYVWILYFAGMLSERYSLKSLSGLLFFSFFALLSNLSFLGITCLSLAWIVLLMLMSFSTLNKNRVLASVILILAFLAAVYPVFSLGMKMKEAGTLYYGTLEGLWDVTGKTLSAYVLFFDADWLCFIFSAIILFLLVSSLYLLRNVGLKKYLSTQTGVLSWYFFGALAVIAVLAELMKVNYPEDRVGMYLVPLLLLFIAQLVYKGKLRKLLFIYPLFTVSLLLHLSLNTSVFTPDERLNDAFYKAVKSELKEGQTLTGYPTMELTWALHERKSQVRHYMQAEREFNAGADVILLKKGMLPAEYKGYSIFAEEKGAGYIALKRIRSLDPSPKALISLQQQSTQSEYLDLAVFPVQDNWKGKRMKIKITGKLKKEGNPEIETIVFTASDKNGMQTFYRPFDLRWYNGITVNPVEFAINTEFVPAAGDSEIKIYLWNKYLFPMEVKEIFVTVSELNNEN